VVVQWELVSPYVGQVSTSTMVLTLLFNLSRGTNGIGEGGNPSRRTCQGWVAERINYLLSCF
jgi:hypothetical protein